LEPTLRIALLYNDDAGEGATLRQIREAIEEHGHAVVRAVEHLDDTSDLLDETADLVVAAGGDGTVAEAARVVAGRGIPLAVLPLGTANNIASSLGHLGPTVELIRRWDLNRLKPLDLGVAVGPSGSTRFVEGVGGGLLPAGIRAMQPSSERRVSSKLTEALETFRDVVLQLEPRACSLSVDGSTVAGDFLLAEALNTPSIGPLLKLSPDADPSDGFLTVVTAGDGHRMTLVAYLEARLAGGDPPLRLPSQRARQVTMRGFGDIHVDDAVISIPPTETISIHIEMAALQRLA
jgi:diacylglycerol kinase family enzyme